MGARFEEVNTDETGNRPRLTMRQHLFRRLLHLSISLTIIYYLFPETIVFVPRKAIIFCLFGVLPAIIEFVRIRRGILLMGQRPHEVNIPGSYLWSTWGALIMILVLPQSIVIPTIMIFSVTDPMLGEIRIWRKWLVLPLGFTFITLLYILFGYPFYLAMVGGLFMVVGESVEATGKFRIRPELVHLYTKMRKIDKVEIFFKTDDNFTTQLVPGFILGFIYLSWPGIFPGDFFTPLG